MDTTVGQMSVFQARAEYARIRRESCLGNKAFDAECRALVSELSDGEEVTYLVWVSAARMVAREHGSYSNPN